MVRKHLDADALPKACEEFKRVLEENGGDINPDAVATKQFASLRNKASISMRNHLERHNSAKFQEYSALTTSAARQEWLADYLLDPKTGGSVGRNWTERTLNTIDSEREVWLTVDELASPRWLNSRENAEIAIKSLVSRPHDNASLRSEGILQYHWFQKAIDKNKTLTQGVSVTTSADCNTESALEVAEHTRDDRSPGYSKPGRAAKRAKVQELPNDPKTRFWQEAIERLGKSVSTLKAAHDRVSRDLSSVHVIESKLKAKKWDTSGPIDFLHAEAQKVRDVNEQMLKHWLDGKAHLSAVTKDTHVEDIARNASGCEEKTKELMDLFKKFSKETLQEFSKSKRFGGPQESNVPREQGAFDLVR